MSAASSVMGGVVRTFLSAGQMAGQIGKIMSTTNWMTMEQVCDELGIGRSTIDTWRRLGRGPRFKRLPNGSLRIQREALDSWLDTLEMV